MVKALSVFLVFLAPALSWSETLYTCRFMATGKYSPSTQEIRDVYLSEQRPVEVLFHNLRTTLRLRVAPGTKALEGTVNGQSQFILEGTAQAGKFESAEAKGTVYCREPRDISTAFVFIPWNRIYIQGEPQTSIIQLKTPADLSNSCYFGRTDEAREITARALGLNLNEVEVDAGQNLIVTRVETRCLKSVGGPDDHKCVQWDIPRPYTYSMSYCDYDPCR